MTSTLPETTPKKSSDAASQRLICFVCTGNTCRSPMAEAVFNHMARQVEPCSACDPQALLKGKNIRAVSAGLAAFGEPISKNACNALLDAGIPSLPDNDYLSHVSHAVESDILSRAELIVGISSSHAIRLMAAFPHLANKITCMPKDVPDPYGGDLEEYKACLATISEGVREIYEKL